MKTTAEWIDELRRKRQLPSDYAAAKYLGITRQAVSKYRNRHVTMDEATCIKLAKGIGVDPAIVIISTHAERTKCPEAINFIDKFLKRAGGTAAAALLSISVGWTPAPVEASALSGDQKMESAVYYVK